MTLVSSHSCLGVGFKSVNAKAERKMIRDWVSSVLENLGLPNIVSPRHNHLTEGSSGLDFCAMKNRHLNFLKRCKQVVASELQRDGYFSRHIYFEA